MRERRRQKGFLSLARSLDVVGYTPLNDKQEMERQNCYETAKVPYVAQISWERRNSVWAIKIHLNSMDPSHGMYINL